MSSRDVLTPEQRRLCMSRNRASDTGPELILRKACFALGLRFRVKYKPTLDDPRLKKLPGTPDFHFPRQRVAVFVDGCFWHGCPQHYKKPATRTEFWSDKLRINRARDLVVNDELHGMGWIAVRVWEHEVEEDATAAAKRVQRVVTSIDREAREQKEDRRIFKRGRI